ncbi:MAG: nucleotidyltransferase domain-containing protein [Caldilineaceae bacterium]|nr:nucleotidyltransferase domain-containing protein [Caldilineaceae bacterium]
MTTTNASTIVQRLWNYCNVLRDDGVSYGDYVEQLTYLLFLKMDDELVKEQGRQSCIDRAGTVPRDIGGFGALRPLTTEDLPVDTNQLAQIVAGATNAPLILVSVSGAHLYGFDSPDSDVDLRGTHLLPLPELIGLDPPQQTLDRSWVENGVEIDLVSHELAKFLHLLLRQNGNYLEQLYSPLVIIETAWVEELRALVKEGTIARHAYHAYAHYAQAQWREWRQQAVNGAGLLKPLLYAYRVSLTGLHLLRTGEVNASLPALAPEYGLAHLADLIAMKVKEKATAQLPVEEHDAALQSLQEQLALAYERSPLPAEPTNRAALNDFLVRVRLAGGSDHGMA